MILASYTKQTIQGILFHTIRNYNDNKFIFITNTVDITIVYSLSTRVYVLYLNDDVEYNMVIYLLRQSTLSIVQCTLYNMQLYKVHYTICDTHNTLYNLL